MMVKPSKSPDGTPYIGGTSDEDAKPTFNYINRSTATADFTSEDERNRWWDSIKDKEPFCKLSVDKSNPCKCTLKLSISQMKNQLNIDEVLKEADIVCNGAPPTPKFYRINSQDLVAVSSSRKELLDWWQRVVNTKPFIYYAADRCVDYPHISLLRMCSEYKNEGCEITSIFTGIFKDKFPVLKPEEVENADYISYWNE